MRIWLYLFSLAYFLAHYPNIRHYDVSGLWPLSKQPYMCIEITVFLLKLARPSDHRDNGHKLACMGGIWRRCAWGPVWRSPRERKDNKRGNTTYSDLLKVETTYWCAKLEDWESQSRSHTHSQHVVSCLHTLETNAWGSGGNTLDQFWSKVRTCYLR